jgi:hypothetical protein
MYFTHIHTYTRLRSEKCINIIQLGEFSLWMMAQVVNKNLTRTPPIRCYRDNKSTWLVSGRIYWRLFLMCSRFTINFPFVTFAQHNRPIQLWNLTTAANKLYNVYCGTRQKRFARFTIIIIIILVLLSRTHTYMRTRVDAITCRILNFVTKQC